MAKPTRPGRGDHSVKHLCGLALASAAMLGMQTCASSTKATPEKPATTTTAQPTATPTPTIRTPPPT